MPGWNLADVCETIAAVQPNAPAQVQGEPRQQGERRCCWRDFDRRASSVAAALVERGARRQDKVAQYLTNRAEYMESVLATWKASLVPVNTNYRYVDAELLYLWDNADVVAVVFEGGFAERIAPLRSRLPRVATWLWVDDGSGPCPDWAEPYEELARNPVELRLPWHRDGDDLALIYTGGTTGMPKGVMWRQDDLYHISNNRRPEPLDLSRGLDGIAEAHRRLGPGRVNLPACPLMHGMGFLTAMAALLNGGSLVSLAGGRFDAAATLDAIERERVQALAIVGDAFARPLLEALDAQPRRWDLSSLAMITSSGVMWSEEVKRGLLRHHPGMVLYDGLGSSEAIGMARSESTGTSTSTTAVFELGASTCVLDDDGRLVPPGSGIVGRLAVRGHIPLGYYKDPEKSAHTFPTIDGVRYSIAGDYATVEADGRIRLLGRGSVCINTGGEKVFPEEVEEALKRCPGIRDAVCVGTPDHRLGEVVVALVELARPSSAAATTGRGFDEAEIITRLKEDLASYKAPKRVLAVDSLGRAPNGKVDYASLRRLAVERLHSPAR